MNRLVVLITLFLSSYLYSIAQQPPCGDNPPAGNTCETAIPLCSLDGVCGNTSLSEYTADFWGEPGFLFTPGTGLIGGMCGLVPTIENNSFMKFVAGSSTVNLGIWVGNCTTGAGLQFIVFRLLEGCGQGEVETFFCINGQSNTDGILENQITGLIPGEIYYIMVDGYNGDECDYAFTAEGDINLTPPIIAFAEDEIVCPGGTTTLHASGGFGDFIWEDSPYLNSTTDSVVTVTLPSTPGTYEFIVGPESLTYCDSEGTIGDTLYIIVDDCDNPLHTDNDGPVCAGETFNLTASSSSGTPTNSSWEGPNGFSSNQQNPTNVSAPATPGIYEYTLTATIDGQEYTSSTLVTVLNCNTPDGCDIEAIMDAFTDAGCIRLDDCQADPCAMYFLNPQTMTGLDAQAFAENLGANLVSIHSVEENQCILDGLQAIEQEGIIWIGFGRNMDYNPNNPDDHEFLWYDQSPIDYTNWNQGEPNNSGGNENCTQIYVDFSQNNGNPGYWNDLNCNSSNTKSIIKVNLCPQVNAGSDITICDGESAQMNASPTILGSQPYTYQWNNGGPNTIENTVSPSTTTAYVLTSEDRYGCFSSDTMQVFVSDAPNIHAGDNVNLCIGESIIISASNPDDATITWDNGIVDGDSFSSEIGDTTYIFTVTAEKEGCTSTDSIHITVHDNPTTEVVADNMLGCVPFEVNFVNAIENHGSCLWDFGDGLTNNEDCDSVSHVYQQMGIYTVTLTVINEFGCETTTVLTDFIEVVEGPTALFSANPIYTTLDETEVIFSNQSIDANSYFWDFDDGEEDFSQNPTHTFPNEEPGVYNVVLTVENEMGCTDSSSILITIDYAEMEFDVPNVFTPNGDFNNDHFKLINPVNIKELDLVILNRWGNLVFESNVVDFQWNGKHNNAGEECADGVYFYKISITDMKGQTEEVNGFVHLIRGKK